MFKSTDEKVTTDLIETLRDGEKGFNDAADKLADTNRSDLVDQFRAAAAQRHGFAAELEQLAKAYGDDIDESGSIAATMHRGWMTLKDALSGDDPDGVISAAAQGENHAVKEYEDALEADISKNLRDVVIRQQSEVTAVASKICALDAAHN